MGLAAGDRIGGPTAMALALGECLVSTRGFDPDKVLDAYRHGGVRDGRDSGPTVAMVFQAMESGLGHREAVLQIHLRSAVKPQAAIRSTAVHPWPLPDSLPTMICPTLSGRMYSHTP